MISYHNKVFRPIQNTENGETTNETVFHYQQEGNVITSDYSGGNVLKGHLVALIKESGELDMRYHQINLKGELMTGICISTPEILADGRIRLYEKWKWTSGDFSEGESIIEEV